MSRIGLWAPILALVALTSCGGDSPTEPSGITVAAISPASGSTFGGTAVTIAGANFGTGAIVTIGGAAATNVTVVSASSITATTGARAAGAADVVVSSGGHSGTLARAFTYVTPAPVVNTPPTIVSLAAIGTRSNEPAQFADLNEEIDVSAAVQDPETPVQQLIYEWTSSAGGTFTGSGATVKWRAPGSSFTPSTATLTLTVIERYTDADASGLPVTKEHRVTATTLVSVHDSTNEVGDMARQFLLDFSDSSITDVPYIMRNFKAGAFCPDGATDETGQVANNRIHFKITASTVSAASVTVNFGGRCPFRLRRGDACAQVVTDWRSIYLDDGSTQHVAGTDQVTAFYVTNDKRWWLCDSDYDGRELPSLRHAFIR